MRRFFSAFPASRLASPLLVASLLLALVRPVAAADSACTAATPVGIAEGLEQHPEIPRVQLVPALNMAPADGDLDIGIARAFKVEEPLIYRLMFQKGGSAVPDAHNAALVERGAVTTRMVPETHGLRTGSYLEQYATLLSMRVPALTRWGWIEGRITVVGCKIGEPQPTFVAQQPIHYSGRWISILAVGLTAMLIYAVVAAGVARAENARRAAERRIHWARYLDPVILSSAGTGRGSISRLQSLFFTVLLFLLLSYILVRAGLLSDLSFTILALMGISGIGAVASKGTDIGRNRLDYENWAWLVGKGWLPSGGLAAENVAKWSDLVTGDEGFDVYRFQMLIFSLVVGLALLLTGFTDLAKFQIPEALLGILGLSQAVYVGGKLVDTPSCAELNKAVEELRKREQAFAHAAIAAAANPAAPVNIVAALGIVPGAEAAQNAAAQAVAPQVLAAKEYRDYAEQQRIARTMFESTLNRPVLATADMEPRLQ